MTTPDLFREYVNQPWVPPVVSDEAMSAAMGYDPVAGTMYNWDQMAPWERGLSIGLDAIDIATLGGGKAITAPIKATTKFITKGDPALTFLRAGDMPTTQAGIGFDSWKYPNYDTYFDSQLPSHTDFMPSFNYALKEPEEGISVFQGLNFPWDISQGPNIFMKPAPNIEGLPAWGAGTQRNLWGQGQFTRPFYEVSGNPLRSVGGDLETLLDPDSASYLQKISPPKPPHLTLDDAKELVRTGKLPKNYSPIMPKVKNPQMEFRTPKELENNPWVTNPVSGESINLVDEFAKYNLFGQRTNPFLRLDDTIESGINRATLHPALPISSPVRAPIQFYPQDEDGNYTPTTGDKILAQLDAFMNKYTSPGGFSYNQLATLAGQGR